jgi:hypothetical protein
MTGYFEAEGVKYKIEPLMSIKESLNLLGLG